MSTRHKVADVEELANDGESVIQEIDGLEIAVFRVDGEYHALANYCVHQGGPLCNGELTGQVTVAEDNWTWEYDDTEQFVLCPWHGWMFDVTTGENVDTDRYTVPTYDVEIADGEVFVVR